MTNTFKYKSILRSCISAQKNVTQKNKIYNIKAKFDFLLSFQKYKCRINYFLNGVFFSHEALLAIWSSFHYIAVFSVEENQTFNLLLLFKNTSIIEDPIFTNMPNHKNFTEEMILSHYFFIERAHRRPNTNTCQPRSSQL